VRRGAAPRRAAPGADRRALRAHRPAPGDLDRRHALAHVPRRRRRPRLGREGPLRHDPRPRRGGAAAPPPPPGKPRRPPRAAVPAPARPVDAHAAAGPRAAGAPAPYGLLPPPPSAYPTRPAHSELPGRPP